MNIVNEMLLDYQSRADSSEGRHQQRAAKPTWLKKVPGRLSMVIVLAAGIVALSVFMIYPKNTQQFVTLTGKHQQGSTEGNVQLLAQRDAMAVVQRAEPEQIGVDEREVVLQDEVMAPVALVGSMPPITTFSPFEEKKPANPAAKKKAETIVTRAGTGTKNVVKTIPENKKAASIAEKISNNETTKLVTATVPQEKSAIPRIDAHNNTAQLAIVAPPVVQASSAQSKQSDNSAPQSIEKKIVPLSNAQLAEQNYQKAMELISLFQQTEAKPLLDKALELQPSHLEARKALTGILIENKEWEAVIKTLQAGLLNNPDSIEMPMWLGRVFLELNRNHEAAKVLESRERYAKSKGDYYVLLAIAYQNSERYADAVDAYLKAIGDDAYKSTRWFGLATVFELMEKWGDAYPAYQQAINTAQLTDDMNAYAKERMEYVRMQLNLAARMDE